ncbi:MAG: outer membrane protein assembly factor BamC, partial [Gammaproteobacteria bacterium]
GASIQRNAERAWLKVDADAEVVWRKLTAFWEYQEVELVTRTPGAGLMETDWFAKGDAKGGGISKVAADLFAALTAKRTALDKFTLRLERAAPGATNVYVSHRRRERIAKEYSNLDRPNDYEWVEREQDAEKVAQLLQAIVLLFERA